MPNRYTHEDLIDFPVSNVWRDAYYEMGLTPLPSPNYHRGTRREASIVDERYVNDLESRLDALVAELQSYKEQLRAMQNRVWPRQSTQPPTDNRTGVIEGL